MFKLIRVTVRTSFPFLFAFVLKELSKNVGRFSASDHPYDEDEIFFIIFHVVS